MQLVATLIAPSRQTPLDPAMVRACCALLDAPAGPRDLDPGLAVDVRFDGPAEALPAIRRRLTDWSADLPVDVIVQPEAGRRKRLLIADMDSTMIGQECIDELAAEVDLKSQVAAITERAMRGEIDFEPALRERVALLAGLHGSVIGRVIDTRITLTPGALALVRTMAANGAYCALVSGGFTAFTSVIAARIGFDEHRANVLVESGGVLTGKVADPILGRQAKRDRLLALCGERSLTADEVLAIGDGANDIDMIKAAGLGIAYRGKPALVEAAAGAIRHGDLSALLFAQGYRRDAFVEP